MRGNVFALDQAPKRTSVNKRALALTDAILSTG